jgi:uncharacterized repeat protein (TIGR03803 family)
MPLVSSIPISPALPGANRIFILFLFLAANAIAARAQVFPDLQYFNWNNGNFPNTSLVQGMNGDLYGVTNEGGAANLGVVFKITTQGLLTVLHSFTGGDGELPFSGLLLAKDGNFYGTTERGGDNNSCSNGCGTIFKISPSGQFATLHRFDGRDGEFPLAGLVQATDGMLYGTTSAGGDSVCRDGCGTVFRITTDGKFEPLHFFDGEDGASPTARLIESSNGGFHGTTDLGGDNACDCGTVFRMTRTGKLKTLHSFDGSDGYDPHGGLVEATDGNFYGTTFGTAEYTPGGTIFEITPEGILTTLYAFDNSDGENPLAALIQATDGNFYGMTQYAGAYGLGTIFQMTPTGTLTELFNFELGEGANPGYALFQATNGILYGATLIGGDYHSCAFSGCGTIFALNIGLNPFVSLERYSGEVGQTGFILGQGFTGTSGVSLNGTPASFKVVSDTFIRATVPAAATTGYVTVTTPTGTLISNLPFHVIR